MTDNIISLTKQQIQQYQALGTNGYETNTTAIANCILELSEKTWRNGYIVRDECILKAIDITVISIVRLKRADKTVHEITEKGNRNSVVSNEKPVLVIECKHHNNIQDDFSDDDIHQLFGYMTAANFPVGVLLSEFKIRFYSSTYTTGKLEIAPYRADVLFTHDHLSSIVDLIKSL